MTDCTMIHNPNWKPNDKSKWIHKNKDYQLVSNTDIPWNVVKVRNQKGVY